MQSLRGVVRVLIVNLALLALSCLVLVKSGQILVKTLSKIAAFLRVSEFVVAFLLMAFATSVPELFVGITAALDKMPALSLGNVIGANILNLTLVIGIAVIIARGIRLRSKKTRKDAYYMIGIAALPLVLMLIGGSLSRLDGVILIAAFFLFVRKMVVQGKAFSKELSEPVKRSEIVFTTILFIINLVLLFISARFVVRSATLISEELGLPPLIIGLFIISLGTTLPELTFGIQSAQSGHPEMALGDLIGSVVVNSSFILGVTSLIYPITTTLMPFLISSIFMLLVAFLFTTFAESGGKLYLKEGISLVLLYIFFVILELYINTLRI